VAVPQLNRALRGGLAVFAIGMLLSCTTIFAGKKVYREGAPPITGRPGDFITIELAADPSTGYSWMLVGHADPRIVTLIDSDFQPAPSAAAGVLGHQRWTFRFVSPGTANLTFGYGRTWANAPAEKATMFTVTVR
jgi:predicted secreted protein